MSLTPCHIHPTPYNNAAIYTLNRTLKTRWRKILVVVEGLYSMEGEICRLKEIVAVCKRCTLHPAP